GRNRVRRFDDRHPVCRHLSGCYGGLRLGAALEQAALDKQAVGAHACWHGIAIAIAGSLRERPRIGGSGGRGPIKAPAASLDRNKPSSNARAPPPPRPLSILNTPPIRRA